MNYKHVVFDIDGTLIDTQKADLQSLQDTLLEITNKKLDLNCLKFSLSIPSVDALKRLHVEDIPHGIRIWIKNRKKYMHTIQLFSGITLLIQYLKGRGIHLGIVTSKNRDEYTNDFLPLGLSNYFETIICTEDTVLPKPSPEPLLKYLKITKANKKEVLYIGDSKNDALCAYNAGIDFALALWGGNSSKNIQAKYCFDHPQNILSLCNSFFKVQCSQSY